MRIIAPSLSLVVAALALSSACAGDDTADMGDTGQASTNGTATGTATDATSTTSGTGTNAGATSTGQTTGTTSTGATSTGAGTAGTTTGTTSGTNTTGTPPGGDDGATDDAALDDMTDDTVTDDMTTDDVATDDTGSMATTDPTDMPTTDPTDMPTTDPTGMPTDDPGDMPGEPMPVVPEVSGSEYSLALSDVIFSADGSSGYVTGLEFGGTNLLTESSVNDTNFGSSFWTAPQTWDWPPALDAAQYDASIDAASNTIIFTSAATELTDGTVSVEKRFSGDSAANAIVLEYTITNEGSAAIGVAPWEITRVRSSGYSFYPAGSETTQEEMPMSEVDGVYWLDYDNAGIDGAGLKNIGDGSEGWLAHVDDGVLFVKLFDDTTAAQKAPNEGEIEIYADGDRAYVELEQQGAYEQLGPGETSTPWRVRWFVRSVPADVSVELGSAALVQVVRDLVAANP